MKAIIKLPSIFEDLGEQDGGDENVEENTKADYIIAVKSMNVKFLKQELRDKNLPISGKRQELIDRLIQSL